MRLKKETGGCEVAGFTWANDGDVVDVPDDLGAELLAIPGGGFSYVEPDAEPADPAPDTTKGKAGTEPAPTDPPADSPAGA